MEPGVCCVPRPVPRVMRQIRHEGSWGIARHISVQDSHIEKEQGRVGRVELRHFERFTSKSTRPQLLQGRVPGWGVEFPAGGVLRRLRRDCMPATKLSVSALANPGGLSLGPPKGREPGGETLGGAASTVLGPDGAVGPSVAVPNPSTKRKRACVSRPRLEAQKAWHRSLAASSRGPRGGGPIGPCGSAREWRRAAPRPILEQSASLGTVPVLAESRSRIAATHAW